jgi:hypothetical protein
MIYECTWRHNTEDQVILTAARSSYLTSKECFWQEPLVADRPTLGTATYGTQPGEVGECESQCIKIATQTVHTAISSAWVKVYGWDTMQSLDALHLAWWISRNAVLHALLWLWPQTKDTAVLPPAYPWHCRNYIQDDVTEFLFYIGATM